MIQLKQNYSNEFIIYANTITNEIEEFGDYFLIGFLNGFTKEWTYAVPHVLIRNTRYIKFGLNIVPSIGEESPLNSSVYLGPSLNWDYKIWNTEFPTIDPANGNIIDSGQMLLEVQEVPEIQYTTYKSANNTLKSFVYYTSDGIWNNVAQLWDYDEMIYKDYRS